MSKTDTNLEVIIAELDKNNRLINKSVTNENTRYKIISEGINITKDEIVKTILGLKSQTHSNFNSIADNQNVINDKLITSQFIDKKFNELNQSISNTLKEELAKISRATWVVFVYIGILSLSLIVLNIYLVSQINSLSTKLDTNYELGYAAGKERVINYFNQFLEEEERGNKLFQNWKKENE